MKQPRARTAKPEVRGALGASRGAFLVTGLAVLGWGYSVEFCQAVFLLMAPMTGVAALNVRTAHKLRNTGFEDLARRLRNHRMLVQMIGMVSIFITAFWGMWTNLHYGALGL